MNIKQVVDALSKNAEDVLRHLYPESSIENNLYKCNVVFKGVTKEISIDLDSSEEHLFDDLFNMDDVINHQNPKFPF